MCPKRLGRRPARRPALDSEGRDVPRETTAESIRETADRRVILENDQAWEGVELPQPIVGEAIEPGHVDDVESDALLREELRREESLVEHHRAVGEEHRVRALSQRSAETDSKLTGQLDPPR